MPLLIQNDCPDCRKFVRTGDFFHSKEIWDRYHKSGWVDGKSDWQDYNEIKPFINKMKAIWVETQKMQKQAELNNPNISIPEWKIKKIISKRSGK